ncbi:DUF167 domain-containing protein [bacterium]|nr:MAG: DUF167 domain-containing protein [bacterium]
MLIKVKVFPGSKKDSIEKKGIDSFEVQVKEKAKEGRANKAVIEILSDYFNIPKEKIRLIRGAKSHHKIFEIKNE